MCVYIYICIYIYIYIYMYTYIYIHIRLISIHIIKKNINKIGYFKLYYPTLMSRHVYVQDRIYHTLNDCIY